MKNIFILHSLNGSTFKSFGPYVEKESNQRDFEFYMPQFPTRENFTFEAFCSVLDKYRGGGTLNRNSIIIAHSISSSYFIKYAARNKLKILAFISVAGNSDYYEKAGDMNKKSIPSADEIQYVKDNIKNKFSLYSDNDSHFPIEILEKHSKNIDSIPYFIKGVGHMGERNNIKQLPELFEIIDNLNV